MTAGRWKGKPTVFQFYLLPQYRSRASELELAPYRTLSPQTILALGMKGLGDNAERIGNLTITSELLAALLNSPTTPLGVE